MEEATRTESSALPLLIIVTQHGAQDHLLSTDLALHGEV